MGNLRKAVLMIGFVLGSVVLGQGQTALAFAHAPATSSWFAEAGAAPGRDVMGGLGVALSVANNQSVFGEIATQTGEGVAQLTQVLFGVKSNFPAMIIQKRKFIPFGIIAYGASIESLATQKVGTATLGGITAATVTSIATSAGLAQRYAAGVETNIKGFDIGMGASGSDTQAGWHVYPFLFVAKQFGKGN